MTRYEMANQVHDTLGVPVTYVVANPSSYAYPDAGRPASLGGVPGDNTNMNHWILWFNDYLGGVEGLNRFRAVSGLVAGTYAEACFMAPQPAYKRLYARMLL